MLVLASILFACISTVFSTTVSKTGPPSQLTTTKTFVVPHVPGQDDTPGLAAVLSNYSTNATILFQKGITYNIFTPIKFPKLTNVEVRIEGNLTYPSDIATIQGQRIF